MAVVYFILGSVVGVEYSGFDLDPVDRQKEPEIGTLFGYFKYRKATAAASFRKDCMYSCGRCCSSSPVSFTEAVYYILLSVLQPLHGYGIIQNVESLSNGRVRLAAGPQCGTINTLLEKDWITALRCWPTETASWEGSSDEAYYMEGTSKKLPFWDLAGCFAPIFHCENPAIYKVFRNFRNLIWNKISRPNHRKRVFRGCLEIMESVGLR